MSTIVMKFGGTSVASEERLRLVARKIVDTKREGHDVVAVVSAMGNTTSELLDLATNLAPTPPRRELDMLLSAGERISMSLLSMAIQEMGEKSISLTGPQSGIHTTDTHFNARIKDVRPDRVAREIGRGKIVIVAGYQGVNSRGEVTTLGRGGSDTTAVAIAAALDASRCEICSDVDGVFSSDPRVVEEAARIDEMNHEEMLELARHGASVLNPRAVEYAWKRDLDVRARSTFDDGQGTMITRDANQHETSVTGIAGQKELARINTANDDESCKLVDKLLGDADPFLVAEHEDGRRDLYVPTEEIADIKSLGRELEDGLDDSVRVETGLASVSAVGLNIGSDTDIRSEVEQVLTDNDINIGRTFCSSHAVATILPKDERVKAMQVLHAHFLEPVPSPGSKEVDDSAERNADRKVA
ncbi:MAG: aspartate kinase [Gammaproteobacteria bacterium]|nr:aspartate kinase [Gammaproteobacteria bacterium]